MFTVQWKDKKLRRDGYPPMDVAGLSPLKVESLQEGKYYRCSLPGTQTLDEFRSRGDSGVLVWEEV